MATGIRRRHSRNCPAKVGKRCNCGAGYEASVYSPRDRKPITKTFLSKSEARSWRAEAKRGIDRATLRAPGGRTLKEAAEAWLDGAERGEIRTRSGTPYKPSTLRGYRRDLNTRVLPMLGSKKLNAIATPDLQGLVDKCEAEGCSASSTRNIIKPPQAIYRRACVREGLPVNPTRDLELPAVRPKEIKIVGKAVAARLLEELPPEDRPVWATALYAGLRYGELRALRWEAVKVSKARGVVKVTESWDPKEGLIEPKSRKSRRTVPIPRRLREVLLEHRERCGNPDKQAFVFGEDEKTPFRLEQLYRRADRAWEFHAAQRACLDRFGTVGYDTVARRKAMVVALREEGHRQRAIAAVLGISVEKVVSDLAGVPRSIANGAERHAPQLRLHQARHTYASFMIAAGINPKALCTFMGHSSIKVTYDIYGHLMPGAEEEGAALLDDYLDAEWKEADWADSGATTAPTTAPMGIIA
jgi:integrase